MEGPESAEARTAGRGNTLFQVGEVHNPRGRRRGVPNKVTVEAREAASEIVDNAAYRTRLMERAIAGELAPGIEFASDAIDGRVCAEHPL